MASVSYSLLFSDGIYMKYTLFLSSCYTLCLLILHVQLLYTLTRYYFEGDGYVAVSCKSSDCVKVFWVDRLTRIGSDSYQKGGQGDLRQIVTVTVPLRLLLTMCSPRN